MYKKIKRIFIIIFATFLLYGCSNNKTCGLLDIPYYKDLDISSIENIRVEWDVCESKPVIFYIDNDDDIKLILDELCSNETYTKSKGKADGGLSRIILIDDNEKETAISLFSIYYKNTRYSYKSDTVYKKIYSIGKDLGYLE